MKSSVVVGIVLGGLAALAAAAVIGRLPGVPCTCTDCTFQSASFHEQSCWHDRTTAQEHRGALTHVKGMRNADLYECGLLVSALSLCHTCCGCHSGGAAEAIMAKTGASRVDCDSAPQVGGHQQQQLFCDQYHTHHDLQLLP